MIVSCGVHLTWVVVGRPSVAELSSPTSVVPIECILRPMTREPVAPQPLFSLKVNVYLVPPSETLAPPPPPRQLFVIIVFVVVVVVVVPRMPRTSHDRQF